jgi:hypothetical protein
MGKANTLAGFEAFDEVERAISGLVSAIDE